MPEHDGNRPQSKHVRTSLVDTGWSEIPPSAEVSPSEADPVTGPPSISDAPASHQVHEPARERPRDLPRYEASIDEDQDAERVPQDDATKRIAYAALLGGAAAGHGGPTASSAEVHEQPTVVGYNPLSDTQARELLAAAAERELTPELPQASGLPSFPSSDNEPPASALANAVGSGPPEPAENAAALAAFEAAAKVFEAESKQSGASAPVAPVSAPPSDGFDDSDLTQRVQLPMPPEVYPAATRATPAMEPEPPPTRDLPGLEGQSPPSAMPAAVGARLGGAAGSEAAALVPSAGRETKGAFPEVSYPTAPPARDTQALGAALAQPVNILGFHCPLWVLFAAVTLMACSVVLVAVRQGMSPAPAPVTSVAAVLSAKAKDPAPAASGSLPERAMAGDLAALRKIADIPESKRSIAEAVAIAKGDAVLAVRRVQEHRTKLKRDRELATSDEAIQRLLDFVADPRTAPDALVVISELPPPLGPDLLYEIWTGTKKSNATTRLARELVYKPSVRAGASDALNVALELRAEPACEDVPPLLPTAEKSGDWRSLHLLGRLLLPRGCGPDQEADCYSCLRDRDTKRQITRAIKAVRSRARPKL